MVNNCRVCTSVFLLALLSSAANAFALELAVFSADISPPLHQRVCVGFVSEFTEIEHPLLAKGIVLRDVTNVYVVCALDYEGLCNDSYDMFRMRIAEAAGTTTSRVAVQSLHQHTAPVFDANADRLLYAAQPMALKSGLDAAESAAASIAEQVKRAVGKLQPVSHVSFGMAKVDRVASNRRVTQPDGSIVARFSAADPGMSEAPEGLIDPWLRVITFYDHDRPLVRLHYYATHPQTSGGGRVTYDVPGIARQRLEQETGIPQIYFTGCGGNVTMSKYNDGSMMARSDLADRLYDGMRRATTDCDEHERQPVSPLRWRTKMVRLPLRADSEFTAAAAREVAANADINFSERLRKAMLVAWIERVEADRPIEFSAWSVAKIDIVQLPGEPFVQFQLAAQKINPDRFVCIAGYGECAPWYLGEDRIYTDRGGFEQSWSFVGPCEQLLHDEISALLTSVE